MWRDRLKIKMSYKILKYVFLRFPNRLFCDWYLRLQDLDLWCFVCPNLIMNTKRRYRVVIQGIKFGKTKVLPLIHLLQNPTSSVKCCYHWNKTKTISQINKYQRYLELHMLCKFFFSWNWNCYENQVTFCFWVLLKSFSRDC